MLKVSQSGVLQMTKRMIFELLLVLIVMYFIYRDSDGKKVVTSAEGNAISHLITVVNDVRKEMERNSIRTQPFVIKESKVRSHASDKKTMYILLTGKKGVFDMNTLVGVTLHEYSHVLCPDRGHTSLFYSIEDKLLEIAERLGHYDTSLGIDPSYPCVGAKN